jgi:hypothetical protein
LNGPLLILTALRYEGSAIGRRLGLRFSSSGAAVGTTSAGEAVELRVVGPRCRGLSRLRYSLDHCRGVVMAGLGGALDPTLGTGEIVVDRKSDLATPAGRWRRGDIHTTPGVVSTAAEKQALFGQTAALVVDMENAIARNVAAAHGLRFLGIRAVSDCADEPLDPATLRWIDAAGGLRRARLAADLCRRPGTIPALWRLGRRSRVAVMNLADAVSQIVTSRECAAERDPVASGGSA